jgi:hypothetical protein
MDGMNKNGIKIINDAEAQALYGGTGWISRNGLYGYPRRKKTKIEISINKVTEFMSKGKTLSWMISHQHHSVTSSRSA